MLFYIRGQVLAGERPYLNRIGTAWTQHKPYAMLVDSFEDAAAWLDSIRTTRQEFYATVAGLSDVHDHFYPLEDLYEHRDVTDSE